MKSIPSFIIAILLFGLCVIEKRSKERVLQTSNGVSEVAGIIVLKDAKSKADSLNSQALDIKKSFVYNFVSNRF